MKRIWIVVLLAGLVGAAVAVQTSRASGDLAPEDDPTGVLALAASAVVAAVAIVLTRGQPHVHPREKLDVQTGVLRIVVDAEGRRALRPALWRIGASSDRRRRERRVALLHELSIALRRCERAWLYAGGEVSPGTTRQEARRALDARVADARVWPQVERASAEAAARGLMLVTLVVATHGAPFELDAIDRETVHAALARLGNTLEQELVAVEVVWSPEEGDAPLDSVALEASMPPGALVALPGATVGTRACAYCGALYPAEQRHCGECGGHAAA